MLYVTATVFHGSANVLSVHTMGHVARAKADRLAPKYQSQIHVLPVNMARPGSKRPKPGDVLATMTEGSGLVAVAAVE
jgi:hypothetical protein